MGIWRYKGNLYDASKDLFLPSGTVVEPGGKWQSWRLRFGIILRESPDLPPSISISL